MPPSTTTGELWTRNSATATTVTHDAPVLLARREWTARIDAHGTLHLTHVDMKNNRDEVGKSLVSSLRTEKARRSEEVVTLGKEVQELNQRVAEVNSHAARVYT